MTLCFDDHDIRLQKLGMEKQNISLKELILLKTSMALALQWRK
jgi:hypothetical protein